MERVSASVRSSASDLPRLKYLPLRPSTSVAISGLMDSDSGPARQAPPSSHKGKNLGTLTSFSARSSVNEVNVPTFR
jgi:hypothetical protein